MKKGIIPVTLGVLVTASGIGLDCLQCNKKEFNRRDYTNMAGALLVGAGIAHIILGALDLILDD